VRQHLTGLAADGFVDRREVRSGPGRPRHLWSLAPGAEALFPKTYGALTNELLTYVADDDPELLERVFERRRQARTERAREQLAGLDLDEAVPVLAGILDEDGYLADAEREPDGTWRIVEHNCAILEVALRYGQACGAELAFIRDVLPGARVERVAHILGGSHVCAYEVRPA
jgi:predicted ArsR family transcriptional regulator